MPPVAAKNVDVHVCPCVSILLSILRGNRLLCVSPALRAWAGPLPPAALFFMSVSKAQGFSAQEESLLQWWRHSSPTGLLPPLALPQEQLEVPEEQA